MEVTLALSPLSVWKYPLFLLKLYFCTKDELESHAVFMGWGGGELCFSEGCALEYFYLPNFILCFRVALPSFLSFFLLLFFFLERLSFLLNKLSVLIMEKSENR